jgi:hypothetical protein
MDFDAFDKEMRRFEQSLDRLIPKTNTETECIRRILKADYELRVGEEYGEFVKEKMMEG